MSPDPVLHLLVGPNGAGKTTFAERVLLPTTHLPFVNADVIAAQLASEERSRLIAARTSFVAETVFSHQSKLALLVEAGRAGYLIAVHVVLIPVDLSVARVAHRVRRGGHAVPEDKIRGRYARLWTHVADALSLANELHVYDNSDAARPYRLVASYRDGQPAMTPAWPVWAPAELRDLPH